VSTTASAFALSDRNSAKASPRLIARDEQQFSAIASTLDDSLAQASRSLELQLRAPGREGQAALERDLEIHRIQSRMRTLRRFRLDLCLGRMVDAQTGEITYIGRTGLADADSERLLVDWRSPAAEPFFAATLAQPLGLASRRRYRWTLGRVSDYWDEAFVEDAADLALDDDSAFVASLGSSRSPKMRDVLATIQADQDAIIRAGSRGALVVDGGPGTGKTVVALHRAAYLLYSEPRLAHGGVLFLGPSRGYLSYVDDVLPSLGEEGVQVCTLRDLVPEGASAVEERSAPKESGELVRAVELAVLRHERPPARGMTVETPWADIPFRADDWEEAFDSAEPGAPHDDARDQVWERILEILSDRLGGQVPVRALDRAVREGALFEVFDAAWPVLDPAAVVADVLQSRPELRRDDPRAWTTADLPLLDAARSRIGDPAAVERRRRAAAAAALEEERMDRVIDELIAAHELDDGEGLAQMLRGRDIRNSLADEAGLAVAEPDELAGPFGHIVVDEAQELTDAQWAMLLRRCPSRSITVVGDRAQARHGFAESWAERLARVGFPGAQVSTLQVNYRTPEEVMAVAEPVIRAVLPDANVPTSIRSSGIPVRRGRPEDARALVDAWLADHGDGLACVIGDASFEAGPRVRVLTPEQSKGLEFDLVVLVRPDGLGEGIEGAVDRYVAMTRATQELVVLG